MSQETEKGFSLKSFIKNHIIGVVIAVALAVAVWYLCRYNLILLLAGFIIGYFFVGIIVELLLGAVSFEKFISKQEQMDAAEPWRVERRKRFRNVKPVESDKDAVLKYVALCNVKVGKMSELTGESLPETPEKKRCKRKAIDEIEIEIESEAEDIERLFEEVEESE